jgi:hypothetical protein
VGTVREGAIVPGAGGGRPLALSIRESDAPERYIFA